jgi:hypothetical protein
MKVLNLYACLGGNRLLWDNCEVMARGIMQENKTNQIQMF